MQATNIMHMINIQLCSYILQINLFTRDCKFANNPLQNPKSAHMLVPSQKGYTRILIGNRSRPRTIVVNIIAGWFRVVQSWPRWQRRADVSPRDVQMCYLSGVSKEERGYDRVT
jgi:hypothetical protein